MTCAFLIAMITLGIIQGGEIVPEPLAFGEPEKINIQGDYIGVSFSPDGKYLALTKPKYQGIYLLDMATRKITTVTSEYGAGYRFSWNKTGSAIAFKASLQTNYALYLYDLSSKKITVLRPESNLIGQPVFNSKGNIIVNYGGECQIISPQGKLLKSIPEVTSNVIVITPDDRYLVYTDMDDRLWAYEIESAKKIPLTDEGERYFSPIASPTENRIVCNKLGGMITLVDVPSGRKIEIDTGDYFYFTPSGKTIFYTKTKDDGERIVEGELYYSSVTKPVPQKLLLPRGIKLASAYHPGRGLAYLNDAGDIFFAPIVKPER